MSTTLEKTRYSSGEPSAVEKWTDEQILISYCQDQDPEIFSILVHRYEQELYSYLRRYLGNAEMAEDAFQATFFRVHLKCDQFQEGRKFRPWLYMIATNQAIDLQRRNKRHRAVSLDRTESNYEGEEVGKLINLLVSNEPSPFSKSNVAERKLWIQEAVDNLAPNLRDVVTLVYYQGLKYREAAEVLGIPVGTVKSRLHSAIYKLNDTWNRTHLDQK